MRVITLIFVLTVGWIPSLMSQCMTIPLSLEYRVRSASAIALVKPINNSTYLANSNGLIMTNHLMEVKAWLKSGRSESQLSLLTPGGIYGDQALVVNPNLIVDPHFEYILFLNEEESTFADTHALRLNPEIKQYTAFEHSQGAIVYQFGQYMDTYAIAPESESSLFEKIQLITGQIIKTPDGEPYIARPFTQNAVSRVVNISGFTPSTSPAGTILASDYLNITGNNFGATQGTIFYRNADNGGGSWISSGVSSDNVSWSNTSVVNKIAQAAGTGFVRVQTAGGTNFDSNTSLTVPYSHLCINSDFFNWGSSNRNKILLVNKNNAGGYTLKLSTSFNGNQNRVESFERALETWQCNTFFNAIIDGTTSINTNSLDGTNAVYWASLGGGTLGICYSYFSAQGNSNCQQQNTVWYLNEMDIGFNSNINWEYGPAPAAGGKYDFESVALHEIGHGHGLGHVINTNSVMHFSIGTNQNKRTLSAGEQDGGNAKMAYSLLPLCLTPSGVFGPMEEHECALPVSLISFDANRVSSSASKLSWTINSSYQNAGFSIHRGRDRNNPSEIAFIPANQPETGEYFFTDENCGSSSAYYTLWQHDIDGRMENLGTRFVESVPSETLQIFQQNKDNIAVSLSPEARGLASFTLFDAKGSILFNGKIEPGNILNIHVPGLHPFVIYNWSMGSENNSGKLILR